MENKYEAILCIVNSGFSEDVMEAARTAGARGGTVIHGRGTASAQAEKMFGISVQPEKEIVIILAQSDIRDEILHAVYQKVGLNSPGQGIAFTLPVSSVAGLSE